MNIKQQFITIIAVFALLSPVPAQDSDNDGKPELSVEQQKRLLERAKKLNKPSEVIPPLLKITAFGTESDVRETAREFYKNMPEDTRITALTKNLRHPMNPLRPVIYRHINKHIDRIKKTGKGKNYGESILHTMVEDRYLQARQEALSVANNLLHRREINKILKPVVKGEEQIPRINAVAALGNLGDPFAVPVVVKRYHKVYGGSQRGHVFFGKQMAYIRDVDPQVATGAVAADPEIDTVSEGFVLDAQVQYIDVYITTIEWKTARAALHRIVGKEIGETPKDWKEWMDNNQENLASWIARTAPEDEKQGGER